MIPKLWLEIRQMKKVAPNKANEENDSQVVARNDANQENDSQVVARNKAKLGK